jgi:hypothetical protein
VEAFKLSKDKRFVEKLTDVVGLYLNPPEKALILCVDEKTQIQALELRIPMISDTQSEIVGHRSDNYRTVVGA